jgi:hypothetical protein
LVGGRIRYGPRFRQGHTSARFAGDQKLSPALPYRIRYGLKYLKENDPKRYACVIAKQSAANRKRPISLVDVPSVLPKKLTEAEKREDIELQAIEHYNAAIRHLDEAIRLLTEGSAIPRGYLPKIQQKALIDGKDWLKSHCFLKSYYGRE